MPITPPITNASRQPHSGSITFGSSTKVGAHRAQRRAEPEAAVDARSVKPRLRAGISSWIVAFTAAYSPPMPAPVRNRNTAKDQKFQAKPEAMVAIR